MSPWVDFRVLRQGLGIEQVLTSYRVPLKRVGHHQLRGPVHYLRMVPASNDLANCVGPSQSVFSADPTRRVVHSRVCVRWAASANETAYLERAIRANTIWPSGIQTQDHIYG